MTDYEYLSELLETRERAWKILGTSNRALVMMPADLRARMIAASVSYRASDEEIVRVLRLQDRPMPARFGDQEVLLWLVLERDAFLVCEPVHGTPMFTDTYGRKHLCNKRFPYPRMSPSVSPGGRRVVKPVPRTDAWHDQS